MARWILLMAVGLLTAQAQAQNLSFQQLDASDLEKVVADFSATFNHTSVSGASSLGNIFGFEVGLVAGIAKTPNINDFAQEAGSTEKVDKLPHGELLGVLTVPAGITVEAGLIPKVGKDDFKFSTFSAAVKWTPTDVFLDWPLSVAIKGHVTKTAVAFKQTISNVDTDFDYKNTITGLTLLASKNFVLVEPYIGVSLLKATGDLSFSGSPAQPVFDPSYSTSNSASASKSSTGVMVGAELKLVFFKLGAEYTNAFGTSRYTGKASFYF